MHDSPIATDLDAANVDALMRAWHEINGLQFRRRMTPPAIALSESSERLGQWRLEERTIAIARALVYDRPWGVVLEVMKHEMAHQFVHEVLGVTDETAHGPVFREVCEKLGIDGRAAGLPESGPGAAPDAAADDDETRVLRRIAKLLALGQSSNQHEAEAAMAEAQRLMLRHNLSTVRRSGYAFRHLGEAKGRTSESERILGAILGEHFFVEVIWVPVWRAREGRRATVLEACGTTSNLALAEHVHTFVSRTAEQLWLDYKRRHGITANRDHQSFLAGVMMGFRDKLRDEKIRHEREGLVWVGDPDLTRYYRQRHPRISHVSRQGTGPSAAQEHGRSAGRGIEVRPPVGGGQGARGGPRLLTGR